MTRFYNSIKACEATNGHGEVNFFRITDGAPDLEGFEPVVAEKGRFIVGHSESGHHHVLEADSVTLMRHPGMDILYAIVKDPSCLKQEAGDPHASQTIAPGCYFITNNVEWNPFLEQARRVAD